MRSRLPPPAARSCCSLAATLGSSVRPTIERAWSSSDVAPPEKTELKLEVWLTVAARSLTLAPLVGLLLPRPPGPRSRGVLGRVLGLSARVPARRTTAAMGLPLPEVSPDEMSLAARGAARSEADRVRSRPPS